MNIELYIANKLCDLEKPDLSIRLKRQFINPTELNTKDAQKSYTITLPSTPANDEIFGYKNVEETVGKFSIYPDAKLYINGILILEGKFRLSEITRDSYKGNLGVPAALTAKDVFGEMKMNQAGSWVLDDWTGLESITQYNKMENAPAIFPLVLYGLLPKISKENFTAKNLLDEQVKLSKNDFPPSVNCTQMLKNIFHNVGYNLSGTALDDKRLNSLYVSYRNPNEHDMQWPINDHLDMAGKWGNYTKIKSKENDTESLHLESKRVNNTATGVSVTNILNSDNHEFIGEQKNIKWLEDSRKGFRIKIPASGLYKIDFSMECKFPVDEIQVGDYKVRKNSLSQNHTSEIHLVRNRDNDLENLNFNNKYTRDVMDQLVADANRSFPEDNNVHFIDPKQDPTFICGLAFGHLHDRGEYKNPISISHCNPMAISGARSWDYPGTDFRAISAVNSPGYRIGTGNNASKREFKVQLENSETFTEEINKTNASGKIQQVIWLEKDELLELIDVTDLKRYEKRWEAGNHFIEYSLKITPFIDYKDWIRINSEGSSTAKMNWNAQPQYKTEGIDLISFLPSEVAINDWIENFCKAFNLNLTHLGGDNFSLDMKSAGFSLNTSLVIDLDQKTSIEQKVNEPLNLPQKYELGFTIDFDEEGLVRDLISKKEVDPNGKPNLEKAYTGAGIFDADNKSTNVVKQNSNFSYCWYKDITVEGEDDKIAVPVITHHEIWDFDYDYEGMVDKRYFSKAQRFWFKDELINLKLADTECEIALVSNTYDDGNKKLVLNYEDHPDSITRNYFMLLNNSKEYTVVECFLTPEEYNDLDKSFVRFNGDLYIVAEADGYDPMGTSKTKLKLIKRI